MFMLILYAIISYSKKCVCIIVTGIEIFVPNRLQFNNIYLLFLKMLCLPDYFIAFHFNSSSFTVDYFHVIVICRIENQSINCTNQIF